MKYRDEIVRGEVRRYVDLPAKADSLRNIQSALTEMLEVEEFITLILYDGRYPFWVRWRCGFEDRPEMVEVYAVFDFGVLEAFRPDEIEEYLIKLAFIKLGIPADIAELCGTLLTNGVDPMFALARQADEKTRVTA